MIIAQPKDLIGAFVNERQGVRPDNPWGSFTALGLLREGRLVAGVIYNNMAYDNIFMHVGALEGCRWMTPAFLHAAFDYPFTQLDRKRVTASIRSRNKRAQEFVKNLGFSYEGTMRCFYPDDDLVLYGLLREDCRYLAMRKAA